MEERKTTLPIVMASILILLVGCKRKTITIQNEGIETEIRADAVQPPKKVDVIYEVGGNTKQELGIAPGTIFRIGRVKAGTKVRLWVKNTNEAGFIRAHILTNSCFRKTGKCGTPDCVAFAEYVVIEARCVNY